MYVEYLKIRNFRNLENVELHLTPGMVVLRGKNGQGKTNLLEALYVAATGRSFRTSPPREMIRFEHKSAEIKAIISRHGVRHEVDIRIEGGKRTIQIDGRKTPSAAGLLEMLNVVAFFPDDLRIAKGSPEERRRFLDRSVANFRPEFYSASALFQRTLKSRNAVLKQMRTPDPTLVEIYNEPLVEYGAQINEARQALLDILLPEAASIFAEVAQLDLPMKAHLQDGVSGDGEFKDKFTNALQENIEKDFRRGTTTVGPHRADLILSIGEHKARSFASQGQQRALILALKMAEVQILSKTLGVTPVLLLDDVSSELDTQRTQKLFSEISRLARQVWVSTTGAAPLPLSEDALLFEVNNGVIHAESEPLSGSI